MKQLFFCILLACCFSCEKQQSIKFAVCTDVHQDLIHDAEDRLSEFVDNATKHKAEYIIQLGDFCMPEEENREFLDIWNSFEGETYHVLGNHDMDISDKVRVQAFWGMNKAYYSFDKGGFHFVVLDANFYTHDGEYVDYSKGNYYAHSKSRCNISPEQLEWLKNDLYATDKLTIVFSHQSLENESGIKNKNELRAIFAAANQNQKKVIACFSGHDHSDTHKLIEGVHYVGLNSTSYAWVGKKMEYAGRFSDEVEKTHPNLKYTLPYEKPAFAIIEISTKGTINIEGVANNFIEPGPEELGVKKHDYTASISNRKLKF